MQATLALKDPAKMWKLDKRQHTTSTRAVLSTKSRDANTSCCQNLKEEIVQRGKTPPIVTDKVLPAGVEEYVDVPYFLNIRHCTLRKYNNISVLMLGHVHWNVANYHNKIHSFKSAHC